MASKLPAQSFKLPKKKAQFRRWLHDIQENVASERYHLQGVQSEAPESLFDVLDRIATPKDADIFLDEATSLAFTAKAEKLKDRILRTDDDDSVFEKLKTCFNQEDKAHLQQELITWKHDSFEPAMVEFDAVAEIWAAQLKGLRAGRNSVGKKQMTDDPLQETVYVRECEDTIAKLNNARILLNTIASHAIEISGGKSDRPKS